MLKDTNLKLTSVATNILGVLARAMLNALLERETCGKKRAVGAVPHTILVIGCYVLQRRQPYQDLGNNYFDERERAAFARQSVRRLDQQGGTRNAGNY